MYLAKSMLTKFIRAVAILVLLTGAAAAQLPMPTFHMGGDKPPLTKEQQEYQKSVDDAYKSTTKKIPEKKSAADPWGDVRSSTATDSKKKQQ